MLTAEVPFANVPVNVLAWIVPEFANMFALVDRLPERVRPVNVPTDVIFGCALVVTVPAVVAVVADPAFAAYDAFATVPTMLPAVRFVNPAPFPINKPLTVAMFPVTLNEVNVPTEVMFG